MESTGGKPEIKITQRGIRVIDFKNNEEQNRFRQNIESLLNDPSELNLLFPLVVNYQYLHEYPADGQYRLRSFPTELLHSDTYNLKPELRHPMEEIILTTNEQRKSNNYPQMEVSGDGWSEFFLQRLGSLADQSQSTRKDNLQEKQSVQQPKSPIVTTRPYNVADKPYIHKTRKNRQGLTVKNGKIMPKRYRRD